MEIDKTTVKDLAIFDGQENVSIFSRLNLCVTSRGEIEMAKNLAVPLATLQAITNVQQAIKFMGTSLQQWPLTISNGTIMVVERFFESVFDSIPVKPSVVGALSYKILSNSDFTLIKYSIGHCFDFVKAMHDFAHFSFEDSTPLLIQQVIDGIKKITSHPKLTAVLRYNKAAEMPAATMLELAHFLRYRYKNDVLQLLQLFGKIDAWYGMANAVKLYQLSFPTFTNSEDTVLEATGLYHILLKEPVSYDIMMNKDSNFIFLTGANMAGKSTYIKAVGIAVFLAHTGMGVPAQYMKLSVLDGMLSNINVIDNVAKGESYFFNEVQRIKATIYKVNNGKKWLILIDELFKGTNVQDAMKCSTSVIEGLLKVKHSLFILSTHLYEIGEELKKHSNIVFNYFETTVTDDQLSFSYHLKQGISNDRLGFLILKKEGVVEMLEKL